MTVKNILTIAAAQVPAWLSIEGMTAGYIFTITIIQLAAWISFYAAINSRWYRRYTARRLFAYLSNSR